MEVWSINCTTCSLVFVPQIVKYIYFFAFCSPLFIFISCIHSKNFYSRTDSQQYKKIPPRLSEIHTFCTLLSKKKEKLFSIWPQSSHLCWFIQFLFSAKYFGRLGIRCPQTMSKFQGPDSANLEFWEWEENLDLHKQCPDPFLESPALYIYIYIYILQYKEQSYISEQVLPRMDSSFPCFLNHVCLSYICSYI